MTSYIFRNVQLLDPAKDRVLGGHEVLVDGDVIREVSARPIQSAGATVIDGGGRTLMPGLIDGNPLDDLGLFQDQGAHLSAIMKGGRFHKNQLS